MLEVGNIEYFKFTGMIIRNENYKMNYENSITKWINIKTNQTVAELRFSERGSKFYVAEDIMEQYVKLFG